MLSYEEKKSLTRRVLTRLGISLATGALLTFLLPPALDSLWSYFQDSNFQPHPVAVLLIRTLNLPAVLYCYCATLPAGLPKSDESLYCMSVGFFFNIPYYTIVIFLFGSLFIKFFNRPEVVTYVRGNP